jgi:hypothetical protein
LLIHTWLNTNIWIGIALGLQCWRKEFVIWYSFGVVSIQSSKFEFFQNISICYISNFYAENHS